MTFPVRPSSGDAVLDKAFRRVVRITTDSIHGAQGMWAVDALGRRNTTIYGSCGMAVSQLIVAITGAAISVNNQAGQKVLVAFTCIFIGEEFCILSHLVSGERQTDRFVALIAHFAAIWGPFAVRTRRGY